MRFVTLARTALAAGALAVACSATAQTAQQPVRMRIQTAVPSASICSTRLSMCRLSSLKFGMP